MSFAVDWSELPPELLQTIATNYISITDYVRFRAVCSSWRTAVPISSHSHPREFPWLMLPLTLSNRRSFFNHLTGDFHRLNLPEASNMRRCAGSSHGWLIFIEETPAIFLLNPLNRAKISLPPLSSFPNVLRFDFYSIGREYTLRSPENDLYYQSLKEMRDYFVKKVILSHNPCRESDFIALTILNKSGCLAYCKKGDSSWKIIAEARSYFEDVIYREGSFYAVDKYGSVAICEIGDDDNSSPKIRFINTQQKIDGDMQYLVDVKGKLLLVSRYLDFEIDIQHYHEVCRTVDFCVFLLDFDGEKWENVDNLDDEVLLFLGQNSSFALLGSDYQGCEGNRIYFTYDYSGAYYDGVSGYDDVGVYHLKDKSIEALNCDPQNSRWPIWITPNLC